VSEPATVLGPNPPTEKGLLSERVLFVDDEPQVLEAIKRSLHQHLNIHTVPSGAEGLRVLQEAGPFALVVSDMRMPSMNGAQFLARARDLAPDTVRMILSGQSDFQSTLAAVNDGHIYRFLCKPCPPDKLLAAVKDGLKQHGLLTAEKVLLEQTLSGTIKMLIEILGMVNPSASSRASRLQRYVIELATLLALPISWQWGTAAYLSQIGCVTLPKEILIKAEAAQVLSDEERRLFESHPGIAGKLLASIPRLQDIAAIVTAQFGPTGFAGKGEDVSLWDVRATGELLLRAAVEFDRLTAHRMSREVTVEKLRAMKLGFPEAVLKALLSLKAVSQEFTVREVRVKELVPGMILDEDLLSLKGIRLVPAGHEVTRTLMVKLASCAEGVGVSEPFRVRVLA
jgi:CheY-like chemotaxis protein